MADVKLDLVGIERLKVNAYRHPRRQRSKDVALEGFAPIRQAEENERQPGLTVFLKVQADVELLQDPDGKQVRLIEQDDDAERVKSTYRLLNVWSRKEASGWERSRPLDHWPTVEASGTRSGSFIVSAASSQERRSIKRRRSV